MLHPESLGETVFMPLPKLTLEIPHNLCVQNVPSVVKTSNVFLYLLCLECLVVFSRWMEICVIDV